MALERTRQRLGIGPEVPDSTVIQQGYEAARTKRPNMTREEYLARLRQYEAQPAAQAPATAAPAKPAPLTPKNLASSVGTGLANIAQEGPYKFTKNLVRDAAGDVSAMGRVALAGPMGGMLPPDSPFYVSPQDVQRASAAATGIIAGGVAGKFLPAGVGAIGKLLRGGAVGGVASGSDAAIRSGGDPLTTAAATGLGAVAGAGAEGVGMYAARRANRGLRMAQTPQPENLPPGVVVDPPAVDVTERRWVTPEPEKDWLQQAVEDMTPAERVRREVSVQKGGPAAKVRPSRPARVPKASREALGKMASGEDMANAQRAALIDEQAAITGRVNDRRSFPRGAAPLKKMLKQQGGDATPRVRSPFERERSFPAEQQGRMLAEVPPTPEPGIPEPKMATAKPDAIAAMGEGAYVEPRPGQLVETTEPVDPHFRARRVKAEKNIPALKRGAKTLALGYHQPFPLVAEVAGGRRFRFRDNVKYSDALEQTQARINNAPEVAMADLDALATKHLTGSGRPKAQERELLSQAMTADDMLHEAARGRKQPLDAATLESHSAELLRAASLEPEVSAMMKAMRAQYDAMIDDLQRRGFAVGKIKGYSMKRGLQALEDQGILQRGASKIGSREPGFMKSRGRADQGYRESDAFQLYQDYRASYLKKIAEADLIDKIRNDETTNLMKSTYQRARKRETGHWPAGYSEITLEVGMPGAGIRRTVRKGGKQATRPVKMVIPTELAETLKKFNPAPYSDAEALALQGGNVAAQSATTLNPANRSLNIVSDLATASMGLPGERGAITGGITLRRLMGGPRAFRDLMRGTSGKPTPTPTGDAFDKALRSGSVSSTFQHEIGGTPVSARVKEYYAPPAADRNPLKAMLEGTRRTVGEAQRFATVSEAYIRESARDEAIKRGLTEEQANEIARQITLPYGSGSSAFAKSKLSRLIGRFAQYPAMMDLRAWRLLTTPGSIARGAAVLTLPGLVEALVNTSTPDREEFERALPPYVRDQDHILVKNDNSPGGFDVYVTRLNPFNETMQRWGMGNIAGRAYKAARGMEPPEEAMPRVQDIPKNYLNTYPLGPMIEAATGKTSSGQNIDLPATTLDDHAENVARRIGRLLPAFRFTRDVIQQGPVKGIENTVKPIGSKPKLSESKMDELLPDRIYTLEKQLGDLTKMMNRAEADGDMEEVARLETRMERVEKELDRLDAFYARRDQR